VTGEDAGPDPPPVLDWRDAKHWSWTAKQCRYCPGLTNLRDSHGSHSHKCCAEDALAQQAADATAAYRQNGQTT